jgi:uncharacterized protein YyaL (SSP411 family)
MIDAMARAGAALDEPEYIIAADDVAGFILSRMHREDGRLLHTYRNGHAKLDAYLDDYTSLANGLVSLYEANFKERWIEEAVRLMDIVLEKFADPDGGGFFYTAADHEQLIARNKELTDSSTPSGNGLAATALLRLGRLLGRSDYLDAAERTLAAALPILQRAPTAAGQMLLALDRHLGPAHELVLVGDMAHDDVKHAVTAIQGRYLPRSVVAVRDSASADPTAARSQHLDNLFAGKESPDGQPVLYICQNFACQEPAVGLAAIKAKLDELTNTSNHA